MKTDTRDTLHLSRSLRLDEITSVSIPSVDQEAAWDLVRVREDGRSDLMTVSTTDCPSCCATASSTTGVRPRPVRTIDGCAPTQGRSRRRRLPGWHSTPTTTTC